MRERWLRLVMAVVIIGAIAGCATVTLTQQGERKISSHPTYEKRQNFFLWGLVGDKYIDTQEVCGPKEVKQMQTQFTFVDELLSFITLGVYAPRTARVWCN